MTITNKLPPELHLVHGTKGENQGIPLPESVKQRIPFAEWLDRPDQFDKKKFIEETADFLFDVYGIGSDQDKHTLAMLADQIDLYVSCNAQIRPEDIVVATNDGKTLAPHPAISIRNNTVKLIIQLMNELGLTPKSRLSSGKPQDDSAVAKFLKGPKG
jgi:P27 family predicted phage terminase small subunit